MAISFPTNEVGDISKTDTKVDTSIGYWGGVGRNAFNSKYPHSFRTWRSFKNANVQGDHVGAFPYSRSVAMVQTNVPLVMLSEGIGSRGAYRDVRTIHMSQWIPPEVVYRPGGFQSVIDNAKAQCLTEALNKLREGKVENGAEIGQARQTANMIAKTLSSLLNAYRAARRGDWGNVPRYLGMSKGSVLSGQFPAKKWLEYQYGWKPLMSSIADNVELLKRQAKQEGNTFSVSRTVKESFKSSSLDPSGFYNTWEGAVKVKVGFKVRLSNSFLHQLDTVGFVNPLSIAWELTPFSFVFDWFIPVGNVLESLSATLGLDPLAGYRSTTSEFTKRSYATPSYCPADFVLTAPGNLTIGQLTFDREVFYGFPLPELYAKRNPFSTTHVISALALLRQTSRR